MRDRRLEISLMRSASVCGQSMGVRLTPIIEKRIVGLDAFRGRTIAVDGNLELYQFLSVIRLRDGSPLRDASGRITSHLNGLMFRTTRLIADYDIRPIFVFDGSPPALKAPEIERRRAAREKAAQDYDLAIRGGDYGVAWSKAVMMSRLTREMVNDAKTLLGYLGIPYLQAPSEGEATAADLVKQDAAWAVSSKDYDALLFGAPRLARFVAIGSREFLPSRGISRVVAPELIELESWLGRLGLSRDQLIDVAILIGTDFNRGVPGVGPKTALRLVRDYGSLAALPSEIRAALPENIDAVRDFFLRPPTAGTDEAVRGIFNPEAALKLLCDERDFARNRVEAALGRLRDREVHQPRLDEFLDTPETIK